jgi:hypothetical protein
LKCFEPRKAPPLTGNKSSSSNQIHLAPIDAPQQAKRRTLADDSTRGACSAAAEKPLKRRNVSLHSPRRLRRRH